VPVADAVEDLYRAHWGEPTRLARFDDGKFVLEVLKWGEAATTEGVPLYATVGASTNPADYHSAGHRVEFILGLAPAQDEVATPLARLPCIRLTLVSC
jgi:hypothetical protein